MSNKLRVLLLVAEAWRGDDSGGNTLDNFFKGMQGVEFAQVYCSDKLPENSVCTKYFQIPQSVVLKNFWTHKKVGHEIADCFFTSNKNVLSNPDRSNGDSKSFKTKIFNWLKKLRPDILITARMFLWQFSNWKTPELEKFIMDFNPDVIYAPCYAFPQHLSLDRYVKKLIGKKMITWSADDSYSLRQFSLDPFFWLNRFWNRHCLRKTYPYFDEFYSISEEEAEEMASVVGKEIGILRKGVTVPETFTPRKIHKPIKFIYAGGLYLNRHKSLIEIANTLRTLNKKVVVAELHIYTGSQLGAKYAALLNDGRSVFNHGLIKPEELTKIYPEFDVAIHCESFDLKYRLMTRLSFSTKIIDCFQSGCAILAIAWKEHTGIKCLQREDAAICVTSVEDIESAVTHIVNHPELIKKYALKAYECEKRNHRIEDVQKKLYDAFVRCSK